DAARGQSLIVWAIAEGRAVAAAVHHPVLDDPELAAGAARGRHRDRRASDTRSADGRSAAMLWGEHVEGH
ncbi:hypothetical protein ACFXJJ_28620, partial [Streptomyces sp. NPDC059233]